MFHLVTGGSGSGKSSYAEQLIQECSGRKRIYIATMIPYGEEGRRRVERHRRMRKEKNFETIEWYTGLAGLKLSENPAVLLECVSNLTANELYDPSGAGTDTAAAVTEGVRLLKEQTDYLVVVTNEVFSDGICYDESTMQYLDYLGRINRNLAMRADHVTEVVYGIPVRI